MALFNLLDCPCIIIPIFGYFFLISFLVGGNEYIRSHWNIATVQDPEVAGEWVRLEGDVVSATEIVNIDIGMDINMNKKRRTKDSTDENLV